MSRLMTEFSDRIKVGLRKKSLTSPSRWACDNRIMGGKSFPGPWRFDHHPWLREMHDSKAVSNVGQKSAQMGFTECVLNITFFKIDIERVDCLYVLPASKPDATDFSASRFDPALELSPYLEKMFSEVKNVGHKRAGATNLYIRGSRSRSGLKSIPAGFIVFDEVAEMTQENIPLAMERAAGQLEKQDWKISTPTIEDDNINAYYKESSQEHFIFKCPCCSRHTELIFPECLTVIGNDLQDQRLATSYLICKECKGILNHLDKINFLKDGKWEANNTQTDVRGFYINQLYSMTVAPGTLARNYIKSMSDEASEQEFYNSNLGVPHAVKGAQINDSNLNDCIGNFRKLDNVQIVSPNKIRTMGVDVGRWLHIEINEWDIPRGTPISEINTHARPRVIWFGKVSNFEALDDLMRRFRINFCVVDANPERRLAHSFACRWWGRVKICFYSRSTSGRLINPSLEDDQGIAVDRTAWLDLALGRFHRGQDGILIPSDIDQEYRDHLKAQVRHYLLDNDGNRIGRYITPIRRADHYGHARNYAEIALSLALGVGTTVDTENPL